VARRLTTLLIVLLAGCGGGGDHARSQNVEVVAEHLEIPWEIAFMPDGRALVTERPGRIRMLEKDGTLRDEPVAEIDVSEQGEGGLLGLALDPEFARNGLVYLYFTTPTAMKLERWQFTGDGMRRETDLIDGTIQAGVVHDSGRIAFGPDDDLYIATGEAGQPELAQDPDSLNGKYLRLTPDQYHGGPSVPEIVSLGHRNPQGFDWEPGTHRLISTEHGPSGGDGPQGYDEINHIEKGNNYGWPEVYGTDHDGFTAPLKVYEDAIAPSGATFSHGDFYFATLRGEALHRLHFDGDRVVSDDTLLKGEYGRLRTVVEGPDGDLYVLTSNRDGRGDPADSDDRILRLTVPR
jgi:glucose/arabinose dehydrogenase